MFVIVFGVAGRAAGEGGVFADHGDYGVIRQTTLTRAVIVEMSAKPSWRCCIKAPTKIARPVSEGEATQY